MNWYLKCLKQYCDFSGRATRTEYWMFVLFNIIFSILFSVIGAYMDLMWLQGVYGIAVLLPGLAVSVRRLHDMGNSGLMYFVGLIPLIGWIWLLVLVCQPSQSGTNKWG